MVAPELGMVAFDAMEGEEIPLSGRRKEGKGQGIAEENWACSKRKKETRKETV